MDEETRLNRQVGEMRNQELEVVRTMVTNLLQNAEREEQVSAVQNVLGQLQAEANTRDVEVQLGE